MYSDLMRFHDTFHKLIGKDGELPKWEEVAGNCGYNAPMEYYTMLVIGETKMAARGGK